MGKDPKNDPELQKLAGKYAKALRENETPEGETMSARAKAARDQMDKRLRELEQENDSDK